MKDVVVHAMHIVYTVPLIYYYRYYFFVIFTEKIEGLEGGSRFCLPQEETSQALNYKSPFFFGVLSIKCIEGCYLLQNNLVL